MAKGIVLRRPSGKRDSVAGGRLRRLPHGLGGLKSKKPAIRKVKFKYCRGFKNGHDYEDPCLARLETWLLTLGCALRDRREWWIKLKKKAIVNTWRKEARRAGAIDKEFDFVLAEAESMAKTYAGPARPAGARGAFAREDLPQELKARLLEGIARLRDMEPVGLEGKKGAVDYHPETNERVVNLVHPSMYCYEEGTTPVIQDCNLDRTSAPEWKDFIGFVPQELVGEEGSAGGSHRLRPNNLQWLPAEFHLSKDGSACTIASYINSLHPKQHAALYSAIADAFVHVTPLFEAVLTSLQQYSSQRRRDIKVMREFSSYRGPWQMPGGRRAMKAKAKAKTISSLSDPPVRPGIPWWGIVPEFKPATADLPKYSLAGATLQVIVKIATTELTAKKPEASGTNWHIEGSCEEHIVATACTYLDSRNVEDAELHFRASVEHPGMSEQEKSACWSIYGLRDREACVQKRGCCRTLEGRSLAWPNILQHQVAPFMLKDRKKPGHRTILVFFLVDPTQRVRSTATVPPLPREWIVMEARALLRVQKRLPLEAWRRVASFIGGMTYDDAAQRRLRLMKERGIKNSGATHRDLELFSFCEH